MCECGHEVENSKLESHQKLDCVFRPITCTYCEITLPFIEKYWNVTSLYLCYDRGEHEEYCGNRTEECHVCNKYITLKGSIGKL